MKKRKKVEIRHNREVITPEMAKKMNCPFPPYKEEKENNFLPKK